MADENKPTPAENGDEKEVKPTENGPKTDPEPKSPETDAATQEADGKKEDATKPESETNAESAPPANDTKEESATVPNETKGSEKTQEAEGKAEEQHAKAPTDFNGTWKAFKHENLEAYLSAAGANFVMRKMASKMQPTMEIIHQEPKFTINVTTAVITKTTEFTVGEPYEFTQPFGEKQECTSEWEGERLMTKGKPLDPKSKAAEQTTIREIIDEELVITFIINDITAKRYFKRVK